MATNNIRHTTKTRLYDLLAASGDLNDAKVHYSQPHEYTRCDVWLGQVTGSVEFAHMKSGRKTRTDVFDIEVWFAAADMGASDGQAVDQKVLDLYDALDNLVSTSPTLVLDGQNVDGLISCVPGDMDGPTSYPIEGGYASFIRAVVTCTARLT